MPKQLRQYLIEVPDDKHYMVRDLIGQGVHVRWVAVQPGSVFDDYDWLFTDESCWPAVIWSVSDIVNEYMHDGEKVWPTKPFEEWNIAEKRQLIDTLVKRCSYLGPTGPSHDNIIQMYETGQFPYS